MRVIYDDTYGGEYVIAEILPEDINENGEVVFPKEVVDKCKFIASNAWEKVKDQIRVLKVPAGIDNVGSLTGSKSLEEVYIAPGTRSFGIYARCPNLKKVVIGEGPRFVFNHTFEDCVSLREISFPSSIVEVQNRAFAGCKSLETITFNSPVKIRPSAPYWYNDYLLANVPALREVRINIGDEEEKALWLAEISEFPEKLLYVKKDLFDDEEYREKLKSTAEAAYIRLGVEVESNMISKLIETKTSMYDETNQKN